MKKIIKMNVFFGPNFEEKMEIIYFEKKQRLLVLGDASRIPKAFWEEIYLQRDWFSPFEVVEILNIKRKTYLKKYNLIREIHPKRGGFLRKRDIIYYYKTSPPGDVLIEGIPGAI